MPESPCVEEVSKVWAPEEELLICRIIAAAVKASTGGFFTPIMTYKRIAECISEAGQRLTRLGYPESSKSPPGL